MELIVLTTVLSLLNIVSFCGLTEASVGQADLNTYVLPPHIHTAVERSRGSLYESLFADQHAP